jgi:hypothetical protein
LIPRNKTLLTNWTNSIWKKSQDCLKVCTNPKLCTNPKDLLPLHSFQELVPWPSG